MVKTWVEERTEDPERMKAFQQERLILEVTELIERLMKEQGVSRTQLAENLGATERYVNKLLDGSTDMTIRTMAEIMFVLRRSLSVNDKPISNPT